jgi:hypothetical protein
VVCVGNSDDNRAVIEAGWGELHPWYQQGVREILVFAPRDSDELETVKLIVDASYRYVTCVAERE